MKQILPQKLFVFKFKNTKEIEEMQQTAFINKHALILFSSEYTKNISYFRLNAKKKIKCYCVCIYISHNKLCSDTSTIAY